MRVEGGNFGLNRRERFSNYEYPRLVANCLNKFFQANEVRMKKMYNVCFGKFEPR